MMLLWPSCRKFGDETSREMIFLHHFCVFTPRIVFQITPLFIHKYSKHNMNLCHFNLMTLAPGCHSFPAIFIFFDNHSTFRRSPRFFSMIHCNGIPTSHIFLACMIVMRILIKLCSQHHCWVPTSLSLMLVIYCFMTGSQDLELLYPDIEPRLLRIYPQYIL